MLKPKKCLLFRLARPIFFYAVLGFYKSVKDGLPSFENLTNTQPYEDVVVIVSQNVCPDAHRAQVIAFTQLIHSEGPESSKIDRITAVFTRKSVLPGQQALWKTQIHARHTMVC
jgi:hypothetical protein